MPLAFPHAPPRRHPSTSQAAYAICNACLGGDPTTISALVQMAMLPPLCALLDLPDARLVLTVIETLEAILQAEASAIPAGVNPCVRLMEEAGGCAYIEELQTHENEEIYHKAITRQSHATHTQSHASHTQSHATHTQPHATHTQSPHPRTYPRTWVTNDH